MRSGRFAALRLRRYFAEWYSPVVIESVTWSAPPPAIGLHENEVHIWRTWLDVEAQEFARLSSYLSADELLRADRFVFSRDRHHFTVARGRLRELLAIYLKCPPESFQFKTGRYGKPSLAEDIPVRFNLTHSYGLALYAFAINRDLGIDIEKKRAEFASKEVAERYFSAAERRELSQLPTEMHTDAFFLCWTRKGSVRQGPRRRFADTTGQLRRVADARQAGNTAKLQISRDGACVPSVPRRSTWVPSWGKANSNRSTSGIDHVNRLSNSRTNDLRIGNDYRDLLRVRALVPSMVYRRNHIKIFLTGCDVSVDIVQVRDRAIRELREWSA